MSVSAERCGRRASDRSGGLFVAFRVQDSGIYVRFVHLFVALNAMSAKVQVWRWFLARLGGMPLSLPAYATLTPVEQLFVVVNLERTERGLAPVVVLSKSLTAVAQAGARAGRDP